MPIDADKVKGTNNDGTLSDEYCIYCYKDGSFVADCTMKEMISESLKHMKEMFKDDPSFNEKEVLEKMNSFFPELKRWKK